MVLINKQPKLSCHMASMPINDRRHCSCFEKLFKWFDNVGEETFYNLPDCALSIGYITKTLEIFLPENKMPKFLIYGM